MAIVLLSDVAKAAGVSTGTASLALRGEPGVKAATREKVVEIAERLGYRPNSAAAVLSSHRMRGTQKQVFVAWLSCVPEDRLRRYPPDREPSSRIAHEEAQRLGIHLEWRNALNPDEIAFFLRELDARGCDGVVWDHCPYEPLPALSWDRFVVVSTQEDRLREGFDVVCANQFRSTIGLGVLFVAIAILNVRFA